MTDFFLFAAPREPSRDQLLKTWGHMLGSLDWDQTAVLAQLLTGVLWSYDDLEWAEPEGETQIGRIPDSLTPALAAVRDDQLNQLAGAWSDEIGPASPGAESLAEDLDGLRFEAQQAVSSNGSLWLRIEL